MLWQSSFVRHVTFDNLKSVYHFRHLLLSPPSHIFCCIIYFWWHIKCGDDAACRQMWLMMRGSRGGNCHYTRMWQVWPLLSCPLLLLSSNNYWQLTTKCWNNSFRAASCSHERTGCKYWTCMKKLRWVDTRYLDTFYFLKASKQIYFIFLFG